MCTISAPGRVSEIREGPDWPQCVLKVHLPRSCRKAEAGETTLGAHHHRKLSMSCLVHPPQRVCGFFVKSYPGIRHRAAGGWEWQRSPLPPSIVNSLHEHVLGPLLYTLSPTPASVWFGLVFCLLSILSTIKEADSCPCWLAGCTEGRCGHQGLEKQHSGAAGQRDVRKGRTPCSFQRGFTCELHSHLNSGLC